VAPPTDRLYGVDVGSTREALLDSAIRLMRRRGLEGLTLRSDAPASGVFHAAQARHFDGLAGLLSAVAARLACEPIATVDQWAEGAAGVPTQHLVAAGRGHARSWSAPNPGSIDRPSEESNP
jgi:AcrR family transcriptional regulator